MLTLHDGVPVPKVIDFGIAKATGAELTEKTLFTRYEQMIGTPAYMSPEQAEMSGLDIDTRADIYGLGVLLYELLTGTTPFDARELRSAGYAEIQRIIREVEPPRPSTRVSALREQGIDGSRDQGIKVGRTEPGAQATGSSSALQGPVARAQGSSVQVIARHRRTDPSSLSKLLRGDLDWIVMKALEKDRARRYASASDFAGDVQRHLSDQPVLASPPGAAYKLRKFIRRNRAGVTAGSLVAAALVIGLTLSTIGFVQASRERTRARDAEAEARQLAMDARAAADRERELRQAAETQRQLAERSATRATIEIAWAEAVTDFFEDTLSSVDPFEGLGREITVVTLLEEATRRIDGGVLSERPLVEARVRKALGRLYLHLHIGRLETAELHFRKALEIWQKHCSKTLPPPQTINRLLDLAEVAEKRDDPFGAEKLYREALAQGRRRQQKDHESARKALSALALFLMNRPIKLAEAESHYREALSIAIKINRENHPAVAESMNALARLLIAREAFDEADKLLQDALTMQRSVLGDEHPDVATTVVNMARLAMAVGDMDGAESFHRDALQMRRKLLGLHKDTSVTMIMLAHLLRDQGKYDEAESLFAEVVELSRKSLPPEHPGLAYGLNNLALVLHAQEKYEEAEGTMLEAVQIQRKALGNEHRDTIQSVGNLAGLYFHIQRYGEAEPLLLEASEWIERHPDTPEPIRAAMLTMLIRTYDATDRSDQAAEWRAKLDALHPPTDVGVRP